MQDSSVARYGSQVPTFTTAPPVGELSPSTERAVRLFESYGVEFYGSQAYEMRLFMERDELGDFKAHNVYVSKPRQSGKSYVARFYCLYCAAVLGLRVLYTAHRARTARKMFKAIEDFVRAHDDWRRALRHPQGIYKAPGYEGVYFTDPKGRPGGSIEFMTRGPGTRGDTADVIVIDEAQELTTEQYEALLPASIAGAEATQALSQQALFVGTPPDEKTRGTVFQSAHDQAHAGVLYGSWWLEWAADAPLPEDADEADALAAMYATNPAIGHRIRESNMLERWGSMSAEGFAREHLGWWADYKTAGVLIDSAIWDASGSKERAPDGLRAFAVKFEPMGTHADVAVAVRPAAGPCRVELVAHHDTTHGLDALAAQVASFAPRASEIVIDGGGGYAQTLIDMLIARRVRPEVLHRPAAFEVAAAASTLLSMLKDGAVTHYACDGQALLDDSATKSKRRDVGRSGGFSFASTDEAPAEPVEAAAMALLYAVRTKRDPNRKAQII